MLADIVTSVPAGRLNNQKMMTLNDIVHSPLFQRPACRAILLPIVVRRVKEFLSGPQEVSRSVAKFFFLLVCLLKVYQFTPSHLSHATTKIPKRKEKVPRIC